MVMRGRHGDVAERADVFSVGGDGGIVGRFVTTRDADCSFDDSRRRTATAKRKSSFVERAQVPTEAA